MTFPGQPLQRRLDVEGHLLAMGMWARIFGWVAAILGGLFSLLGVIGLALSSDGKVLSAIVILVVMFGVGILLLSLGRGLEAHNDNSRQVALVLAWLALAYTIFNAFVNGGAARTDAELTGVLLGSLLGIAYHGFAIVVLGRAAAVCGADYRQAYPAGRSPGRPPTAACSSG